MKTLLRAMLPERFRAWILNQCARLSSQNSKIEALLSEYEALEFDEKTHTFAITDPELDWDERKQLRKSLMNHLREIPPLVSIRLGDIITGYYDQCLERYLFERINQNFANEDTCWLKLAQNNSCISHVSPEIEFNAGARKAVLAKRKGLLADPTLADQLDRDAEGFVFQLSNNLNPNDDRAIALYKRISTQGFSDAISSRSPIIIGYSEDTGLYNLISGRHRVAVLRYLASQGKLSENLTISCHVVRYPFSSLVVTRPYTEGCKTCKWGGISDPGEGTHQDFYVREGIAVMRGKHKQKGGRQKWDAIAPVFSELVKGKRVVDIGAHRGMFCLKALEYGAESATALETNPQMVEWLQAMRRDYTLNNFKVIAGDFYAEKDYNTLKQADYGTAFYFGIVHHLLRLGIQRKILYSYNELLARMARIVSHGVLIEFAIPREADLKTPELSAYAEAFSQTSFEASAAKIFKKVEILGRCKYKSGNRYGRFMYSCQVK